MTEQSAIRNRKKLQTVSKHDTTLEYQIYGQKETLLLKGMSSKKYNPYAEKADISRTICARDYKGLNNFGQNGVVEWKS